MKIRLTSFLLPPLPKEVYRDKSRIHNNGTYGYIKHTANKGWYSTGSISETTEQIERVSKEILNK